MNPKTQFRLKSLRLDKKLTRLDVAESIGISEYMYRLIETGESSFGFHIAWRLAIFFEVTIDYLFCNRN